jgi:hypothetical protein
MPSLGLSKILGFSKLPKLGASRTAFVDDGHSADWEATKDARRTTSVLISQLKDWGDAAATTLAGRLRDAEAKAKTGSYQPAAEDYAKLKTEVEEAHDDLRVLRETNVAKEALQQHLNVADKVVAGEAADGPLSGAITDYTAAKTDFETVTKSVAAATGAARVQAARNLRDSADRVRRAAEKLLTDYAASGAADAQILKERRESLEASTRVIFHRAASLEPVTLRQEDLLKKFLKIRLPNNDDDDAASIQALQAKLVQAEALLREATTEDERAFFREWTRDRLVIGLARKYTAADGTPEAALKTEFDAADESFERLLTSDKPDYRQGLVALQSSVKLANDLLAARVKEANETVQTIVTGKRKQKAEAAAQAVLDDDKMPVAVLRSLTLERKIELMKAIRADDPVDDPFSAPPQIPPDSDRSKAQAKLYKAMEMDADFIAKQETLQQNVVNELMKHKGELQAARDNWSLISQEERLKVLELLVDTHCRTCNFKKPKNAIQLGPLEEHTAGLFINAEKTIYLNSNSPALADFELALDLIFHENSHNYQYFLVDRLKRESRTTGVAKLSPADPVYQQARLFELNAATGGYVKSSDDHEGYRKQPLEDHAWSAGPTMAARLIQELDRNP